jgi:hypothetical protein
MSRKHMGVGLIGMAKKTICLRCYDLKHNEASFSMISTDLLYLRDAQMPRTQEFVPTTDRRTDCFPLLRVRGNYATLCI